MIGLKSSAFRIWSFAAYGERLLLAVEAAFGSVHVCLGNRGPDIFKAQALRRKRRGIDLHTDRRLLVALNCHQPDTGHLTQLLRQNRVREVVDLSQGGGCPK